MALKGVKVIELAGLAPGPFCGMILADFGAKVIRVDKLKSEQGLPDTLARGKQSISVNLKRAEGVDVVKKLCGSADVLIEPFRKGVMEKLGLGPDVLLTSNPHLVYARLTGYGQKGSMAEAAGHDINYIAKSGVLSALGRKNEKPTAPVNLLADFGGGGLTCALGIMMALFERSTSGQGQVVDCSMTAGSAYLASFLWSTKNAKIPMVWGKPRGDNLLDTGAAFYDTYLTADNKYMAVGSLEPQFYQCLLKGLGLDPTEYPQLQDQLPLKQKFTEIFQSKTREEWCQIFEKLDACVTPVLEMNEAPNHPHNIENGTFIKAPSGKYEPAPAPELVRTPPVKESLPLPRVGQHTRDILTGLGYGGQEIRELLTKGAVEEETLSKL